MCHSSNFGPTNLSSVSRWVRCLCSRYQMTRESSAHLTSTTSRFALCLWTTRRQARATSLLPQLVPDSTSARTPKLSWEIQQRTRLLTFITWLCTTWRLGGWCDLSAWPTCVQTRRSWWRTSLNCWRASLRRLTASRRETDKRFPRSCRENSKSSSKIIFFCVLIDEENTVSLGSVVYYVWFKATNSPFGYGKNRVGEE